MGEKLSDYERALRVSEWRREHPHEEFPDWANLSGANLSGAKLNWANLRGANLSWANLFGADLRGADFGDGVIWSDEIVRTKKP